MKQAVGPDPLFSLGTLSEGPRQIQFCDVHLKQDHNFPPAPQLQYETVSVDQTFSYSTGDRRGIGDQQHKGNNNMNVIQALFCEGSPNADLESSCPGLQKKKRQGSAINNEGARDDMMRADSRSIARRSVKSHIIQNPQSRVETGHLI